MKFKAANAKYQNIFTKHDV